MIRPEWEASLSPLSREHLRIAAERIAAVKQKGGRVTVVTGSGPNIHEGVTTLIAELIHKGVVDGVLTSSAVVAHEMAGPRNGINHRGRDVSGRVGNQGQKSAHRASMPNR